MSEIMIGNPLLQSTDFLLEQSFVTLKLPNSFCLLWSIHVPDVYVNRGRSGSRIHFFVTRYERMKIVPKSLTWLTLPVFKYQHIALNMSNSAV